MNKSGGSRSSYFRVVYQTIIALAAEENKITSKKNETLCFRRSMNTNVDSLDLFFDPVCALWVNNSRYEQQHSEKYFLLWWWVKHGARWLNVWCVWLQYKTQGSSPASQLQSTVRKKDGGCTFYHNQRRTKLTHWAYRKIRFNGSRSYTNSIALVEFEWLSSFLLFFVRSFRVFVRKVL